MVIIHITILYDSSYWLTDRWAPPDDRRALSGLDFRIRPEVTSTPMCPGKHLVWDSRQSIVCSFTFQLLSQLIFFIRYEWLSKLHSNGRGQNSVSKDLDLRLFFWFPKKKLKILLHFLFTALCNSALLWMATLVRYNDKGIFDIVFNSQSNTPHEIKYMSMTYNPEHTEPYEC